MAAKVGDSIKRTKPNEVGDPNFLKQGKDNNVLAWKEFMKRETGEEYGFLANLFDTNGEIYVPPAVTAADYTPLYAVDAEHVSATVLGRLREGAEIARNKQVSTLKANRPKLYATMKKSISSSSGELIKQHADFAGNEASKDPHELWRIILATHLTERNGQSAAMRLIDKSNAENAFLAFRQRSFESISTFKNKFDEHLLVLTAAGFAEIPEEEKAVKFLEKLDMQRYGYMTAELMNGVRKGQPYPDTLHKAWDISSNWVRSGVASSSGDNSFHSVFLADDRNDVKPRGDRKKAKKYLPVTKKAVDSATDPKNQKVRIDTRSCYGCGKQGHIKRNCPEAEIKIHFTEGEFDEGDEGEEEDEWQSAFVAGWVEVEERWWCWNIFLSIFEACSIIFVWMFSERESPELNQTVLFGAHELLLDNEASVSIFKDSALLNNVRNSKKPISMGGIQKGSPSLRVTRQGEFRDFGTVHHNQNAAANILSFAEMVDLGCRVQYSEKCYEIVIT